MTLGAEQLTGSQQIMAAADPDASGMSDRSGDETAGRNVLLTAVVDEADHHRTLEIVRSAGGEV